jgi:hypothetical protein
VSNYNWESLKGFEDQVLVGAEVVNGTGDVKLNTRQHAGGDSDAVILTMPAEKALDLARLISRQAHDAMRQQWNEANLTG